MQDIQALAALEMQGRETGTAGAELAAAHIARRMEETAFSRPAKTKLHPTPGTAAPAPDRATASRPAGRIQTAVC